METTEKKPEQGQKMVKIKLFKGSGKYADDVFVGLNGETYKIQRGVEVEVPAGVAEILEHSAQQDALTSERLEKLAEKAQHICHSRGPERIRTA